MAASYLSLAYDLMKTPGDEGDESVSNTDLAAHQSEYIDRATIDDAAHRLEPEGLMAAVASDGTPVVVGRTKSGRLVVAHDACPHDGGLLSTGFIEGESIVCARHGWEFEVDAGATGETRADRCPKPLALCPIRRRTSPSPADS